MVDIKNITVIRGGVQILKNSNWVFSSGSMTCLIGSSGAGKTTLLKVIAGLIACNEGEVFVDGKAMSQCSPLERAGNIGYVFQQFNLFPHLTVLENCIEPQLINHIDKVTAKNNALKRLADLGMIDFLDRYSHQLSGGQQQRVALARALCLNPKVLLFDEPTASLDPKNTITFVKILQKLAEEGITIIASSQDMFFVNAMECSLVSLQGGAIEKKSYFES